jgi:predicted DNA-binding transcriptional regulator YafY
VTTADTIAAAIHARQRLNFVYDEHARTVEPHTLGSDVHGTGVLCGYQTAGGSRSGKPAGWKFFRIVEISNLCVANGEFFSPRPEYRQNDRAFANIAAQL